MILLGKIECNKIGRFILIHYRDTHGNIQKSGISGKT